MRSKQDIHNSPQYMDRVDDYQLPSSAAQSIDSIIPGIFTFTILWRNVDGRDSCNANEPLERGWVKNGDLGAIDLRQVRASASPQTPDFPTKFDFQACETSTKAPSNSY